MTSRYKAHLLLPELGAQRTLWAAVAIAFAILAGGVIAAEWPVRWEGDPIRYRALIEAAGLFEEGLTDVALSELDSPTLQRSAEAFLLKGVIALYSPKSELPEAQRWLEKAAKAGAPGADALFGFLLLDEKECGACARKAAHWFEQAIVRRADRYARLGLAEALVQQRYAAGEIQAQLDAILAEGVQDTVRLWALTWRGSLEESRGIAAAFTAEAAKQGLAFAQFRLATRYLPPEDHDAKLWLAMAALQGDHDAIGRLGAAADPSLMGEAEQRLLAIAADLSTELGKAAAWCEGRFRGDTVQEKACRMTALQSHIGCELPATVIATLGIHEFERSEAYDQCRTKALAD
jgi:TPR repeat protein